MNTEATIMAAQLEATLRTRRVAMELVQHERLEALKAARWEVYDALTRVYDGMRSIPVPEVSL